LCKGYFDTVTKDRWRQRPVNRIHYHFVVKDHRTPAELEELFETVFWCEMGQSDFNIRIIPFNTTYGWKGFIGYFVKLRGNENIPFKKGSRLRQFYIVNKVKWWSPKSREMLDQEMRRYAMVCERLLMMGRFSKTDLYRFDGRPEADQVRLKKVLAGQTDQELYDCFSILLNKEPQFQTIPPRWFKTLRCYPIKYIDLLHAIHERLRNTDDSDITIYLAVYHGLEE
jgi:hypothetical protein